VRSLARVLLSAIVAGLAARTTYLSVVHIHGSDAGRHRLESAALLFAIAATLVRFTLNERGESARGVSSPRSVVRWMTFCAIATAVYWPALSIGFLSDDFGLVERATAWDLSPVTSTLFRPVPLLAWATVLHLGAGAAGLHGLNALLHGTNAYLVSRIADRWLGGRVSSILAGLLVLASPLATEPVVWCSGVFDLTATALVLAAVLLAERYDGPEPPTSTRLTFAAVIAAAVLSKEAGAVAPFLVLVSAWIRGRVPVRLRIDLVVLVLAIGLFGVVRLLTSPDVEPISVTRYGLQRALFSGFGSLAAPFHLDVVRDSPWLAVASVVLVIALLTRFSLQAGSAHQFKVAVGSIAWILIAIAPVWPILVIPGDLQGSRLLYLAGPGWATLLVVSTQSRRRAIRFVTTGVVAILIALAAWSSVRQIRHWRDAAGLRDLVERSAAANDAIKQCPEVSLSKLPDSVRGAYVFRNSVREAFARDLGIAVVATPRTPGCAFEWSDEQSLFVRR
jgi:hypothetical protein